MQSQVTRLTIENILPITLDARIVAMRWDIFPWSLVLDLDVPVAEDDRTSMRRAWLCFSGFSSITCKFDHARLPTGIWLTSPIAMSVKGDGFTEYRFSALIPRFNDCGSIMDNPTEVVVLRAECINAVISKEFAKAEAYGLPWSDRVALATDQAFIDVLGKN